ncbi:MAG: hypothetical protein H7839_01230 [Magnetococcus sp. YQC-5]
MLPTIKEIHAEMLQQPEYWRIFLMNFVDDFRRSKNLSLIAEPICPANHRLDALVAAVVDSLCAESSLAPPEWTETIAPLSKPWFVAGLENLKAIALVESPAPFRVRNIFVLNNFLSRA